ncbi:acyl-CoA thioesterase I [Oryzomicrobium terrae]|uniref:Acyl-CoA thioesterase I n=1 Tax=Oryzomicrobium terrae TaxID=1735038 RepID=A0A5C1E9Y0_9RHOO|nr:acyl-CoA thioesterase I [Oryzomicrobium terrae]
MHSGVASRISGRIRHWIGAPLGRWLDRRQPSPPPPGVGTAAWAAGPTSTHPCAHAANRAPARPGRLPARARGLLATALLALLLPIPTVQAAPAGVRTLLVFGDSLSAGYGIRQDAAWPSLLAERLKTKAPAYTVLNASISGETTAGGVSRLPPLLEKHKPAVVVIELGANDGLRGLPVGEMKKNLVTMTRAAKAAGAKVLLVRIELPPNYGAYARTVGDAFNEVAKAEKLPVPPFLLDQVASDRRLFQADGLHPVAEAQGRLLDNVWPALAPLLK